MLIRVLALPIIAILFIATAGLVAATVTGSSSNTSRPSDVAPLTAAERAALMRLAAQRLRAIGRSSEANAIEKRAQHVAVDRDKASSGVGPSYSATVRWLQDHVPTLGNVTYSNPNAPGTVNDVQAVRTTSFNISNCVVGWTQQISQSGNVRRTQINYAKIPFNEVRLVRWDAPRKVLVFDTTRPILERFGAPNTRGTTSRYSIFTEAAAHDELGHLIEAFRRLAVLCGGAKP